MARKRKATYVGSGKENSEPQVGKDISKLALAQRARRERERNLKQSTARISEQHLLRDTRAQPLHEIYIGAARDEHCANIGNNVHIREDTQRANATPQAMHKSSYADKGKGLLTYANEKDTYLAQPLHEIYIGAARDEHCANIGNNVHIREDTQRANATPQAMHKSSYADKGKGLLTYANEKDTYLAQPLHEIDIGAAHDEHCVNIGNNVHIREGKDASYAQLYIYDPASALEVRNRRNQQLRKDVLQTIQETLLQVNPFVDKFRQAYAILDQLDIAEQTLPAHLHYSSSTDRRRYNLPTTDEIAVVVPRDGTKASGMRDIILHLRGDNGLMRINECHPTYLPLHYVLLFPHGELGWEPEMKKWDVKNNRPTAVRLTQMEYYSHRLFERRTEYSTILRGGKLFQEFLVDAWAATEQNRLTYYKLNQMLGETGKSLYDFPPMPQSIENWSTVVGNRLIIEHRLLQIQAQQVDTETNIGRLNSGQRSAYDAIICSVLENKGTTFFLNGGAGTGKTFLYNTIAQKCRGLGHIVVTVASSGIASLLLEGGRTAHSTFSIPLDVLENSICGFTKQSIQAELFRETKMIIWDEVPMQHKYCVEAVDRTLRDIRDNPKPFGVGTNPQEVVHLPTTIGRCQDLNELLSTVYPQLGVANVSTPTFLTERTILSARNDDVNAINCIALTIFPGNSYTYLAADKMSEDDGMDRSITNRYPNEYLNSLDPTGLPPFKLQLKAGCPIILLRNIAPKDGLCEDDDDLFGKDAPTTLDYIGDCSSSLFHKSQILWRWSFNVRAVREKNDAARKMLTLVMKCQ
ncbi:hypothetical protein RHMOL_Rhmol11G0122300 [Rhododendron molle]|uniref:Uncharacterized protein n=1 Tax=Rhododendron molle TaxID=49168 RepID=A0ACC0LRB5_RHOML|nr:hypothetical protein RHMOL_Rhmol11G0122300 [Rhododendron molle]